MSVGRGEDECRVQSILNSPQAFCVSAFQRVRGEGGIKERMHAARTGYRQEVDARLRALEAENLQLKARIKELEGLLGEIGKPRKV